MKKSQMTAIALLVVLSLALTGCGSQSVPETTAAAPVETTAAEPIPLGLSQFSLTTATWSSPNGATVMLSATPLGYDEGCSAAFIVRLEGEEVANIPCEWNGTSYTASADLNADNDLCYYVLMTAADGTTAEVPVNTPNHVTDEALINLADSLESYCHLMVEDTVFEEGKLTISAGSAQVQAPKITNNGEAVTVAEAALVLNFGGQEASRETLTLAEAETDALYEAALKDVTLSVPVMENDQQLTLVLHVTLSNGQILTAEGGTFFYNDGTLLTAVG